jgi:hypothetical protein
VIEIIAVPCSLSSRASCQADRHRFGLRSGLYAVLSYGRAETGCISIRPSALRHGAAQSVNRMAGELSEMSATSSWRMWSMLCRTRSPRFAETHRRSFEADSFASASPRRPVPSPWLPRPLLSLPRTGRPFHGLVGDDAGRMGLGKALFGSGKSQSPTTSRTEISLDDL